MVNTFEGELYSKDEQRFCIVVSRFNDFIGKKLLDGAVDTFKRLNVKEENIDVVWVPGAFEIPVTISKLINKKNYSAFLALGAIIKGSTDHYDYVCSELSKGIAQISLNNSLPIMFGVLTVDTLEQAIERAGTKQGNKGAECAKAAIEMANLFHKIG